MTQPESTPAKGEVSPEALSEIYKAFVENDPNLAGREAIAKLYEEAPPYTVEELMADFGVNRTRIHPDAS